VEHFTVQVRRKSEGKGLTIGLPRKYRVRKREIAIKTAVMNAIIKVISSGMLLHESWGGKGEGFR
jgi:hypothetical protein